ARGGGSSGSGGGAGGSGGGGGSNPVNPYDVGPYNNLKSRSVVGDGLELHHTPQTHPSLQVIPGYDPYTAPTIVLSRAEHTAIPTIRGPYNGSPRDLLARDIRNLRRYTNAPNSALFDLIRLARQTYPGVF
ncbi:MAG: hypothetical protein MN733_21410, partial [Nitrososphaera sp.]|nr:hypothetical protein [Nitrososphaera sp.]